VVGRMITARDNQSSQRKPTPVPLCPPQITWRDPQLNRGCFGGKLANTYLSYGMTSLHIP
jgi:hypothetical protein